MESKVYRLEELVESIEESINNLLKIKEQQSDLIDVIKKNAKRKFKDFIEASENQLKEADEKIKNLENQKDNIKIIIEKAKNDNSFDEFLSLVLETLVKF